MLMPVLVIVVVLIAIFLGVAASRSDTFRVQRSTSINTPPATIFPFINDFHRWESWSPYDRMDPAMKKTDSGAASGKGAVYEWSGNNKVGQGRMEIIEASPEKIQLKLDFIRPFEGHNLGEFALEPRGGTTYVTWSIDGPRPFVAKAMSVFVNMDRLVGKDFEVGLATLKRLAEQ
jgi:Polyketide cyclase / dehydrase and lipid transport